MGNFRKISVTLVFRSLYIRILPAEACINGFCTVNIVTVKK